jgi:hypothetical protein
MQSVADAGWSGGAAAALAAGGYTDAGGATVVLGTGSSGWVRPNQGVVSEVDERRRVMAIRCATHVPPLGESIDGAAELQLWHDRYVLRRVYLNQ